MNLQQLYYFSAISRFSSFTKAAQHLMVTQSTLSHSIADLEQEIGLPLLEREYSAVVLTSYGDIFLQHANRIIRELESMQDKFHEIKTPNRGRVRVAFSSTLSHGFISNLIQDFYEDAANKDIKFQFSETIATKRSQKDMLDDKIDICFAAKVDDDKFDFFAIGTEELVAITAKGYPIGKQEHVALKDFEGETLVTYSDDCGTRQFIEKAFADADVSLHDILEMETERMILSAVATGLGVGIIPKASVDDSHVAALQLENSGLWRPLYMIWPKSRFMKPVVRLFRDFVIHQIQQFGEYELE